MTDATEVWTDRDDRLTDVLLAYVTAVERGEAPDRRAVLADHPEFAADLADFFDGRDELDRLAAPLRSAVLLGSAAGRRGGAVQADADPRRDLGELGDYRLLREVGRGGMGVVYEAEQISLRRRVAVKVLPFAAAVDPRHLQRFRHEAQAAAQLHHPGIVPVFAVGAERGVHFYAMQFVDGRSLADLVRDLRSPTPPRDPAPAGDPTRPVAAAPTEPAAGRLDPARRAAELVRQAAVALEHAHQVGVVHRDVKPANLLLDDRGRVWVTDFGLAQVRNDGGLTATGELVGTLRYMSPEQAAGVRGAVDHRTDVYSLGVTLYELLTLAPAFDGADRQELIRQIVADEPRPPRAVNRAVPVELETVVLKAVSKAPADRYASAQEFADDLGRFLDHQPVLARRPTVADRAARWVRRHRGAATAAVAGLLLAVVGLAASTGAVVREQRRTEAAYERERDRAREADEQRAAAEENYRRARRAVDLFVEVSDEEVLDSPPLLSLRKRLLEAAATYHQELLADRADDPVGRTDLEATRARLVRLLDDLAALYDSHAIMLLDQKPIRDELGVTPGQYARLTGVLSELAARWSDRYLEGHPAADAGPRPFTALVQASRRTVDGVLTAGQAARLKQILFQQTGPHVFSPANLQALDLSDDQKAQVRRIQGEAKRTDVRLFFPPGSREENARRHTEVWVEAVGRFVALLTPAQRSRWDALRGEPYRGEIRFPPTPPAPARPAAKL